MEKTTWSHNAIKGSVIGELITKPKLLNFADRFVADAMIQDTYHLHWRVRTEPNTTGQLLNCNIGQKVEIFGIKGDLCKGAWNNAKRQIVPIKIQRILSH